MGMLKVWAKKKSKTRSWKSYLKKFRKKLSKKKGGWKTWLKKWIKKKASKKKGGWKSWGKKVFSKAKSWWRSKTTTKKWKITTKGSWKTMLKVWAKKKSKTGS